MLDCVLDLSHHNDVTSFHQVAGSGVLGVIHKATQGESMRDAEYADRRERAMSVGLLWGAYHFGTRFNPVGQADWFLAKAGVQGGELLCLDWEGNDGDTMSRLCAERFAGRIHSETGRWPVLYSGHAFLNAQLKGLRAEDTILSNCRLWMARYSKGTWMANSSFTNRMKPRAPKCFGGWPLWQYTSGGRCPGVAGRVDRNRFAGTAAELRDWWSS